MSLVIGFINYLLIKGELKWEKEKEEENLIGAQRKLIRAKSQI